MKLEFVLKIIGYGKYSKAFIQYLIHYLNDEELAMYLTLAKKKWDMKNQKLLNEVNKRVKYCKNIGIKYLLLNVKLNLVRVLNMKEENRKLYHKIKKEFGKIPNTCRSFIGKSLKMDGAYNANHHFKEFRTWSKNHIRDSIDIALELRAKAIKFDRAGKYKEAAIVYYCVFQHALKYPHPTYITNGLNNAAWYRKFSDLERAVKDSEELAYYLGYYLEHSTAIIGYLDTILVISKENNDYDTFYQTARILDFYYESLTKNIPEKREKYKKRVLNTRKHCLLRKKKGVKRDEVSNSKTLQKFLNEKISDPRPFAKEKGLPHVSLYRVLDGKRKTVRIKTLTAIVQSLELELSFDNPREVNYVLICEKTDRQFVLNCEKLREMSLFERKKLLLRGVFVQLPFDSVDYVKLFSLVEDVEMFIKYVEKDYDLKGFINSCFESEHAYFKGRDALFNILVEAIGDEKSLSELPDLYTSLKSTEEIELLNGYFREYARYSTTDWDFDVEEVLENRGADPSYPGIASFCKRLNLSPLFGYVCTWFYEGEKRERLIAILIGKVV